MRRCVSCAFYSQVFRVPTTYLRRSVQHQPRQRLQKVAMGESEANTPRKENVRLNSCRVSGAGRFARVRPVPPNAAQTLSNAMNEGYSLRSNPSLSSEAAPRRRSNEVRFIQIQKRPAFPRAVWISNLYDVLRRVSATLSFAPRSLFSYASCSAFRNAAVFSTRRGFPTSRISV